MTVLFAWIALVLAFRSSIMTPYFVPTESMFPTILAGDRVLASKVAYDLHIPFTDKKIITTGKLRRGDIVVFRSPETPSIDCIKRVVGLPGDRVLWKHNQLFINGTKQALQMKAPQARKVTGQGLRGGDNIYYESLGPLRYQILRPKDVSEGPMTSHRHGIDREFLVPASSVFVLGDNRTESKDSRHWGEIPISYIKGKIKIVLWSIAQSPETSPSEEGRWSRVGKLVL